MKERREQQVAEKNESREAVPRTGVEINTAVKDAGKAERKAMPGNENIFIFFMSILPIMGLNDCKVEY